MLDIIRKPIRKLLLISGQRDLQTTPFVIISDNCWGAEIYKEFNRPYNTPFVGLFFHSSCFVQLLEDFDHYINQPLVFVTKTKYAVEQLNYPVALLGKEIEIHFLHYKDEAEAQDKWDRRLARMNKNTSLDHYYFKLSAEATADCDNQPEQVLRLLDRFYVLPFKNKISFATLDYNNNNHIPIKTDRLPDGLSLYGISRVLFDVPFWLKKGKISKTFWNTIVKRI